MDIAQEVDARQIARRVQARAEAKALLQKELPRSRTLPWLFASLALGGAAVGANYWSNPGQLLDAIAGAGIALGFGAGIACHRLSKRLDALIKLLELEE